MFRNKTARINALAFFFFWILVLLAGADFPPPVGFLWVVLIVAICSAVVYWRIPPYIMWYRKCRFARYWRVTLEGLIGGVLVASFFVSLGNGEPTVTAGPEDYAIFISVLAILGIVNALALYFINGWVTSHISPGRK